MTHSIDSLDKDWIIVIAGFFITFLAFGTTYSIVIMLDIFMDEFGASKSEVSMISSIAFSLECFLGPVVSILQEKYTAKKVVLVGSTFISVAFVASALAPNIIFLYFTLGFLRGIGMACVYLPLNVQVAFHFDKARSLATALVFSGSHVGSFIHPHLIRLLIATYGWREAILLIGAVTLNSLPLSLLLLPTCQKRDSRSQVNDEPKSGNNCLENRECLDCSNDVAEFIPEDVSGCKEIIYTTHTTELVIEKDRNNSQEEVCNSSAPGICPQANNVDIAARGECMPKSMGLMYRELSVRKDALRNPVSFLLKNAQKRPTDPALDYLKNLNVLDVGIDFLSIKTLAHQNEAATSSDRNFTRTSSHPDQLGSIMGKDGNANMCSASLHKASSAPIYSRPTDDTLQRTRDPRLACSDEAYIDKKDNSNTEIVRLSSEIVSAVPESVKNNPVSASKRSKLSSHFTNWTEQAPLLRNFKNLQFLSFLACDFLFCLVYNSPSVFIADWGKELEISIDKTTLLVSIIGIGNIAGRPIIASIADTWAQHRIFLFATVICIAGLVTAITPLMKHFYFLAFFVFQYGFFAGGSQTLLIPILTDMITLSDLSYAFGVLICFDGIALLAGPPLLGLLPSYDFTFAISGVMMLVSSAVLLIGQLIIRTRSEKKNEVLGEFTRSSI